MKKGLPTKLATSFKRGIFSNHPVPLSKEGSTSLPKPLAPQGQGDVAVYAIASTEFWYRKRSLCPKGLAMSAYEIKLRLF